MKLNDIKRVSVYLHTGERYLYAIEFKDNSYLPIINCVGDYALEGFFLKTVTYKYGYFPVLVDEKGNPLLSYNNIEIMEESNYSEVVSFNIEQYVNYNYTELTNRYTKEMLDSVNIGDYLNYYRLIAEGKAKLSYLNIPKKATPVRTALDRPKIEIPKENFIDLLFGKQKLPTLEEIFSDGVFESLEIDKNNPYNDVDNNVLVIPRDVKPQYNRTLELIQYFARVYGVPFSKKMVFSRRNELVDKKDYLLKTILEPELNATNIVFSASCNFNKNHIAPLLEEYTCGIVAKEDYKVGNKISWKLDYVQRLVKTIKDRISEIDSNIREKKEAYYNLVKYKEVIETVLEIMNINNSIGDFKQVISGIGSGTAIMDKDDEDIYWFHPKIKLLETFRYQTYSPSIQSKQTIVKECICAPKGYKVLSFDISAQDAYFLVWFIMEDTEIKELTVKLGSPYLAFLVRLGHDPSKENKNLSKVPTLSIMNGKSKKVMLEEFEGTEEGLQIILDIYNFIVNDNGYRNHEAKCKLQNKSQNPIRWDVFGTEKPITKKYWEDADKPRRQALNGPFQISSAGLLGMSLDSMCYDIFNDKHKDNLGNIITFNEFRPIIPVHDECLVLVKDTILEEGRKLLTYYMRPQIEGCGRVSGELTEGQSYIHK